MVLCSVNPFILCPVELARVLDQWFRVREGSMGRLVSDRGLVLRSGTLVDCEGRKCSGSGSIDGWCRITRSECLEGRIS